MSQVPPQFKRKQKPVLNGVLIIVLCVVVSMVSSIISVSIALNHVSSNNGVTVYQTTGNASGSTEIKDISDIAAKCGPSVVEIQTESVATSNFFQQQYVQQGAGSGVIFSEDGYIITNNHVIEGATSIAVRTNDGTEYEATLIGTDAQTDIAVIKVEAKDLVPATIGDSDSLEVGDAAIAIGNPLGELGGTVTQGIISALERQVTVGNESMTLLQTDAAINPGNSGGGLFDANGNLIGIVNAKESSTGIEGLGFAIPINSTLETIEELIQNGTVTNRPALNVSLYDYKNSNSYYYTDDREEGCYIVQIIKGGAAHKAGLQQNDRIISFDGKEISCTADVKAILRKHKIGDEVEIVVDRNGKNVTKTVKLQANSNQ